MPEATSNVEFAHKIHEEGHHHSHPTDHRARWVEIVEAVVLATVAVATAWSGYQASKWDLHVHSWSPRSANRASRTCSQAERREQRWLQMPAGLFAFRLSLGSTF
jgi:hypothetical protein